MCGQNLEASSHVTAEVPFFDRPSAFGGGPTLRQILHNKRVGALKETIGAVAGARYDPSISLPPRSSGATPLSAVISQRRPYILVPPRAASGA